MKMHACRDYEVQYPDPIDVGAGETVTVTRRDEQFTHWLWCRAADGREGWVPETVLSSTEPGSARVLESYAATEVPLKAGEQIEVLKEFDGFALIRRADGQTGWVPLSVLDRDL